MSHIMKSDMEYRLEIVKLLTEADPNLPTNTLLGRAQKIFSFLLRDSPALQENTHDKE